MKKPTVEMKNDGKDLERFQAMLKKVVSVPKKEIEAREKAAKEKKRRPKPVNG